VPDWVKDLIDGWLQSAGILSGRVFRRVTRAGTVWGSGLSEKVEPASRNSLHTIFGELARGSAIRRAKN